MDAKLFKVLVKSVREGGAILRGAVRPSRIFRVVNSRSRVRRGSAKRKRRLR